MVNLDYISMKTAQDMVAGSGNKSDKENLATKSLGVLLENGPYGLILYLESHEKKDISHRYREQLLSLCDTNLIRKFLHEGSAPDIPTSGTFQTITAWLQALAQNLDKYLFLKRLWQQALIYARYHAKALDEDTDREKEATE
ncbi:MAG: hypothetical protein JRJ03_10270 [Deltaproteobacteria bacterium]|nr:hypothetical protein [Deltaproteobacteria bacterium]